jgi:hypothetical protein
MFFFYKFLFQNLQDKVSEAESNGLLLIDDMLPEALNNHQWLKNYLKTHRFACSLA